MTTIASVKGAVCRHYGIPSAELVIRHGKRLDPHPREVAMFLARALTGKSLRQIGNQFGNRHHSTILYAIRQVAMQRANRPIIATTLDLIAEEAREGR